MAFFNRTCKLYVYSVFLASLFFNTAHADALNPPDGWWIYTADDDGLVVDIDGYIKVNGQTEINTKPVKLPVTTFKKEIGLVMWNRIFQLNEYGNLGAADVTTKLVSKGYVVNTQTQKITKTTLSDKYKCLDNTLHATIGVAANCSIDYLNRVNGTLYSYSLSRTTTNPDRFYFVQCEKATGGSCFPENYNNVQKLSGVTDIEEILKTDLGDFMVTNNVGVAESFIYASNREYVVNPLTQEVLRRLQYDASDDQDIKPELDPDGNPTGGFKIPAFCDWATPVCNFINWSKDTVGLTGEDGTAPEKTTSLGDGESFDPSASPQEWDLSQYGCPAPVTFPMTFSGVTQEIPISFELACQTAEKARVWFVFAAYLCGGLIIAGVKNA